MLYLPFFLRRLRLRCHWNAVTAAAIAVTLAQIGGLTELDPEDGHAEDEASVTTPTAGLQTLAPARSDWRSRPLHFPRTV